VAHRFLANLLSPRIHDTYIHKFSLKTDRDEDTLEKSKHRWEHNVKTDLKETRCEEID
jgi:hypothetical protein